LAHLLLRFADPTSGSITLGDVNLKNISQHDLNDRMGFVFQDSGHLRTTIADNIRLARPDASFGAVREAAEKARLHELIVSLPKGYDTVLDEETRLSSGEMQRLAIARALLADTPILVLDEATAFADPVSERALQMALSRLARERSLLVIAHRLHTIVGADNILVLDKGNIVESGTHVALLAANGMYAAMWVASEEGSADTKQKDVEAAFGMVRESEV
jgi:ABC-type multidrug transport system fused ATPase/permease subunit